MEWMIEDQDFCFITSDCTCNCTIRACPSAALRAGLRAP
jgi:hypothetical protein